MKYIDVNVCDPFPPPKRISYHAHQTVEEAMLEIADHIHNLVELADLAKDRHATGVGGVPTAEWTNRARDRRRCDQALRCSMPPKLSICLNNLYYAICYEMHKSYEAGRAAGVDLLGQLARGDITVHDVNAVR